MSEAAEAEIRAHAQAGDADAATTAAIRLYGDEVFSFLIARLRAEDVAGDVFAETCEDLWASLPRFEWRCSMRTWFYKLARSAAVRHERAPANRSGQRVAMSRAPELIAEVRSRTAAYLRSEVKSEVQKLREALDTDEQTLLILRVDRELDWNEIAWVLGEADADDAAGQKKAAARLRQRFQALKERLRELAEERGLLGE